MKSTVVELPTSAAAILVRLTLIAVSPSVHINER